MIRLIRISKAEKFGKYFTKCYDEDDINQIFGCFKRFRINYKRFAFVTSIDIREVNKDVHENRLLTVQGIGEDYNMSARSHYTILNI